MGVELGRGGVAVLGTAGFSSEVCGCASGTLASTEWPLVPVVDWPWLPLGRGLLEWPLLLALAPLDVAQAVARTRASALVATAALGSAVVVTPANWPVVKFHQKRRVVVWQPSSSSTWRPTSLRRAVKCVPVFRNVLLHSGHDSGYGIANAGASG